MRTFSTYIKAINPNTGEMSTFSGTPIQAPSKQWAREYCDGNELGYLFIGDELIETVPWNNYENRISYYTANQN